MVYHPLTMTLLVASFSPITSIITFVGLILYMLYHAVSVCCILVNERKSINPPPLAEVPDPNHME